MHYLLKSGFWRNALRDPLTWMALAVDFVPVFMVLFFGWRAEALVLLYWSENVVIGVAAAIRIIWSSLYLKTAGIFLALFLVPFFCLHYGMFCFGHGVFVFSFANNPELGMGNTAPSLFKLFQMVELVRVAIPGMTIVLALITVYQAIAIARDYGSWDNQHRRLPFEEMLAPYGRIVTLHIAIIGAGVLLIALGNPMSGVLVLILIRMVVSILGRGWRDRQPSSQS